MNFTQVARLKADLHHDYETKLVELREASKRVQEKADHQCNLQRHLIIFIAFENKISTLLIFLIKLIKEQNRQLGRGNLEISASNSRLGEALCGQGGRVCSLQRTRAYSTRS